MIQFIKGPWKSGEDFVEIKDKAAGKGAFELRKMGLGFVGILGDKLPKEKHIAAARAALNYFAEELPKRDVIILDEINVAVSLGLISENEVLNLVHNLAPEKIVVFTGRGAPQSFIEQADLVTEMKEVKHPFNKKELAKIAVDF
jgi:cob(I)alamin adenosyltransferase